MTAEAKRKRWRRSSLIGIGLVNVATLTWATNMALGRLLRDDIGPLTLSAARFSIASVLFALLLQRRPEADRQLYQENTTGGLSSRSRLLLLVMALSGVVVFAPTLYLGLRFTTTVNATLINGLGPLITGLLAALLIREPMTRRQVTGAIVGLAGIIILISGSSLLFWQTMQINVGDIIMVGAVTLWALYSVVGRQVMHQRSSLSATAFSSFLGLPFLLLAAVWEISRNPPSVRLELVVALLYIGIVPGVIGFLAWNEGVRRLGSSGAMVFYNTLPLYGVLLGFLVLGETIGLPHLIGGALIIGGGIWAARGH
jgi:drug/metabolite transporter (DMT)-like permease